MHVYKLKTLVVVYQNPNAECNIENLHKSQANLFEDPNENV